MDNRQLDADLSVQDASPEGLSSTEAARRLAQYGENVLAEHHVSALERLARFFWGPIPWMIEIAAVHFVHIKLEVTPSATLLMT